MTLRLLYVLRRRWPVIAALVVVGALAGLAIGPRGGSSTPTYVSSVVISADLAVANKTEVQQDLVEARQGQVAEAVAKQLGWLTAREVAQRVSAEFDEETFVATITARAKTPAQAKALASSFGENFVVAGNGGATADADKQLATLTADRNAAKKALQDFLTANAAELDGDNPSALVLSEQAALEADYNGAESALSELQATLVPTDVYNLINVTDARLQAASKLQVLNNPLFRVALGMLLGLAAALVVVVVAERANPRIDDPSQAAELVGAPVIGMIPLLSRRRRALIHRVDPEEFSGPYAEAFRTLRAHLEFRAAAEKLDKQPRIMVTSATPAEGKSTTAAFLALSFVEAEKSPVVIGGDLRRPSIHRLFGVERVPGLTTRSLPGGTSIPLTSIVRRDPVSGVTLVPSGPSVDSVNEVMRDLLAVTEVAQASGQVVILDTAPVRVANDAIDFLAAVDWVVVVVQAGKSTKRSVAQMMHTLRMNGAEVVGVVLVGSAEAADSTRDYYSYYAPEDQRRGGGDRRRGGDRRKAERHLVAAS